MSVPHRCGVDIADCPFCAEPENMRVRPDGKGWFQVWCAACGARGSTCYTEAGAIILWSQERVGGPAHVSPAEGGITGRQGP